MPSEVFLGTRQNCKVFIISAFSEKTTYSSGMFFVTACDKTMIGICLDVRTQGAKLFALFFLVNSYATRCELNVSRDCPLPQKSRRTLVDVVCSVNWSPCYGPQLDSSVLIRLCYILLVSDNGRMSSSISVQRLSLFL